MKLDNLHLQIILFCKTGWMKDTKWRLPTKDASNWDLMTWQPIYATFRLRRTIYLPFWLMSHWFCCQFWANNFSCRSHVTNHHGTTGNYIITMISWWHHKDMHGLKAFTRELWCQRQHSKSMSCLLRATTPDHSHFYQNKLQVHQIHIVD